MTLPTPAPRPPTQDIIRFTLDGPAPGAPRMTQRDKWKQRPCVMAYRRFCDRLRAAAPTLPAAEDVDEITVVATYAPPPSWSKAKRSNAMGTKKRSKPDGDNILKAVCDALWERDEALGDKTVHRRWGQRDVISVMIKTVRDGNGDAVGAGRREGGGQ